jgi:hypothetical protein
MCETGRSARLLWVLYHFLPWNGVLWTRGKYRRGSKPCLMGGGGGGSVGGTKFIWDRLISRKRSSLSISRFRGSEIF